MTDPVSAFRQLLEAMPAGAGSSVDLLLAQMPPDKALLVRLAAIPHSFDRATLAVMAPELVTSAELDRRYEELARLSIVLKDGEQLMLHDDARVHLLHWWQQPEHRGQLRQASAALVEWLVRTGGQAAADTETTAEERRGRCMYHRVAVDAQAGFAEFEQLFAGARHRFDLTRCTTLLQLLREQEPLLDASQKLKLNYHAGKLAADNQQYELAQQYFDQVLSATALTPSLNIKTLARQGHLALAGGDLALAEARYLQALAIAEQALPDYPIDELLLDLAVVKRDSNDLDAAERGLEQAISVASSRGSAASLAACYNALGNVHLRRGDHAAAIAAYQLSLENLRQLGEHFRTAQTLNNLGMAWVRQGDLARGEQLLGESLQIKREAGDSVGQANTLSNLVEVYRRRGDTARAIELNLQAIELFKCGNSEGNYAVAYRNLGSLYRDAGQAELAEQAFKHASERFLRRGAREEADIALQGSASLQPHAGLPWWAWATLVLGLLVLVLAIIAALMEASGEPESAFIVSPDGRRWVLSISDETGTAITVDGEESGPYDELLDGSPLFSPDGTRLAFAVRRETQWLLLLDGAQQVAQGHIVANSLAFSPDSQRFAYAVGLPGQQRVILDGLAGPEFDEIFPGTTIFSPDSQQLSYRARRGERRSLVIDHQVGPGFDRISLTPWLFSPDSRHTAYSVIEGERAFMVVDGQVGAAQEEIFDYLPLFSPDSQRLAYGIRDGDKQRLVIDGRAQSAYDELYWGEQVFGPDSRRFAYGARRGSETLVVIDGAEHAAADGLLAGTPLFSPDGQRLAYGVLQDGHWRVVEGDQAGESWDGILQATPQFSPDSQQLAYGALRGGQWHIVVDGVVGPGYTELIVGAALFSPDSQHIAFGACQDNGEVQECFAVIDGNRHGPYEALSPPVFGPSGQVRYHVYSQEQGIFLVELQPWL